MANVKLLGSVPFVICLQIYPVLMPFDGNDGISTTPLTALVMSSAYPPPPNAVLIVCKDTFLDLSLPFT